MPTYQVTDSQSGTVLQLTGDSPPTPDELTNIFSQYGQKTPEPQTPPTDAGDKTSTAGAFARGAATSVLPAFTARGGAWAGARLGIAGGAAIPGLGETGIPELVGGIGGAIIGGILGDRAQKAALKAAAPEVHDELEKFQNEDAKDHPIASAAGGLAGSLPAFKLQNPMVAAQGLAALAKIARGNTATAVEKQAAKTFATQLGIGTAAGVISPLVQGQKPTAGDITQGIAQMILFGEGRGFKGGEENAKGIRSDTGSTAQAGQTPEGSQDRGGQNLEQPTPAQHEPVEQGAGGKKSKTGSVAPYRIEGGEDGGFAITAPDGSTISEHATLDEAKRAMDDLRKPPAQQKSALISDTQKVSRDVFQMGQKDFFDWSKGVKGGLTGEAYRIGQAAKTPQDLAELQSKVDTLKQQFQEALSTKDMGKMQVLGPKIQFFNEAIGAAKGTGSAGEALRKEQPNYQPPHPEPAPVPKLSPEVQGHLDAAVKDMGVKHVLADASDPNNPFAKRLGDSIATVDPESGHAIINPENLERYAKQAPPEKRGLLVRSIVSEENNHLHVSNEDAEKFAKTKTSAERAIIEHRYGVKGMTDRMLGHEAINFELHDLARMEPHQMITATRRERWTLETLQMLEKIIRNIRRALGTKASIEGDAILNKIQKNLSIGKKELGLKSNLPKARDRNEEKVYSGEYWMHPDGTMEKAPDGHLDAAINQHGAPNAEGDGKNTYDHMANKGFSRVFATGSQILTSGTPSPKQMATLKNIAIESGKMLIWDTPSGRDKLIYDPREDEAPAARPRKDRVPFDTVGRNDPRRKYSNWEYYEERLQDPSLLADSIPLGNYSPGLLAVPVGGNRVSGTLGCAESFDKKTAQEISEKLKGKQGFPAVHVFPIPDRESGGVSEDSYSVGWGHKIDWEEGLHEWGDEDYHSRLGSQFGYLEHPPSGKEPFWTLRGQKEFPREYGFPAARPRKRNESVFQDKFFLPGEATQKPAQSTQAVPISGEAPVVPPEERTSAEAAGALPRLTGTQLNDKATGWVQNAMKGVSSALGEGRASAAPKFRDFVEYMQGQQPEIKEGQLHEMWADTVAKSLDKASGEQLGDLVKGIWGRQVTEAVGSGRKGFFRGIISGAQKVADLPKSGQFKLTEEVSGRTPAERYQDERRVASIARSRDKVIGAIFNKLVKPIMDDINFKAPTTAPEDLRYGGGKTIGAVHEFSAQDERNPEQLGKELVDESRRSKDDPLTATKRLTALVDRKSGTVDLVSTYRHPAQGTMLVDPNSPQRMHSPLDSILRRYRVIGSFLRDSPVQNFKQHFASLHEFNDKFADEARQRYHAETSYNPESISAEQFQREIGGRMQGSEMGHLMGPGKALVAGAGRSEMEQSQRTPMTTPEAHSILDYINEQQGSIESADDVKEAMMALPSELEYQKGYAKSKLAAIPGAREGSILRQAISGFTKLARGLQIKNPDLSNEELLNMVAQRIYENNRDAENLEGFAKRTMAESRPTHGEDFEAEDSPRAINRRKIADERDRIAGELKNFAVRTMAEIGRNPTREAMATGYDKAETLGKVDARATGWTIRLASQDKDNFYGKPEILSAARAKIAAGGIKARYHYDAEALAESERLMKEDEEVKKAAAFANRPRDVKNQQMMLEGEVANKGLGQLIQRRLIKSGHLRVSKSTLYHDANAKDNLGLLGEQVRQGIEQAEQMVKRGNYFDRYVGRKWLAGAQKLKEEVEFAHAHWDNPELIETAMRTRRELDYQFDLEKDQGYNIEYDPEYLPGRHDGELFSQYSVLFSGKKVLGGRFRKPGVFKNAYDAVSKGPYIPATHDIASVAESRVRSGMVGVNKNRWWDALLGTKDEESGLPITSEGKEVAGKVGPPSPDYGTEIKTTSGKTVYVLSGYEDIIHALVDPSALRKNVVGRAALKAGGFLKHTVMAGDLFHLGRVGYYAASISGIGKAKWRPGWASLDFKESDLPKAVAGNIISKETANELLEPLPFNNKGVLTTRNRLELAKEFQQQGFNVGQIRDAIYQDLVKNVPGFGNYAKFLFDRWTRGLMMNSATTEYIRISKLHPTDDSREIIRNIAKDLNPYFGSIGRQGWIKSQTFQDLSQLVLLAPQWQEGLLKKELSPIRLATQTKRVFSGRDTMLRGVGRGLLAMMVFTQVINMITRRQPTWKNNEKEHKWDADLGNNVWLSPLSVFNELTGDLIRLGETKPKVWDAIQEIGENKLSFWGRAAMVLATGKSGSGEYQTTTAGVLGSAVKQLAPTPITFSKVAQAGAHALVPNLVGPVTPGQVESSIFSTFGFKTHTGIDPVTRMETSAHEFAKAHGFPVEAAAVGYTDAPSYAQLRYFLKIGDVAKAKKMIQQLARNGNDNATIKAMEEWPRRPFTGNLKAEARWKQSMSPEELEQYQQAVNERYELLNKFRDTLNQ